MKKLILINGDLATGKSHFAIIVRDRFNLPLFTKDEYKEEFANHYEYDTYEKNHKLSVMALDEVVNRFKEIAPTGKDLILEANFHENYLKILSDLADTYGYSILNINLVGDPDILFKRYMNRIVNENRHPVHTVNKLDEIDKFRKYTLDRRNEKMYGKVLEIDANNFSYQSDEKILKQIKDFLDE